jgi:hypothetical protein
VATLTTYEDLLFDVQTNHAPQVVELFPSKKDIFNVDLDTRTINVPQFLSVRYDHNAEVIYFKCGRFYDNMDLTNTICVIEYINADKKPGIYKVPFYDISKYDINEEDSEVITPTILIPWSVGGLATATAGKITFNLHFYILEADGKTFSYSMRTKPAEGTILHGIDYTDEDLKDFNLDPTVAE